MAYTWNSLKFEPPAGLVDQTVVTFVDSDESPTFEIRVTTDDRGKVAFPAWVDAQVQDLVRSIPAFSSQTRTEPKPGTSVVEYRAKSPQGMPMKQKQAYIDLGQKVAIVVVSAADKPSPKADAAFDQIVRTLS